MGRRGDNLILFGCPGVGKSTLGKEVALCLNWDFLDTDSLLEEREGFSCRELYRQVGEREFRKREERVVASLIGFEQKVIAVGGGCVESDYNRSVLSSLGWMIALILPEDVLVRRKVYEDSPAYLSGLCKGEQFVELLHQRIFWVRTIADVQLDIHQCTVDQSVNLILGWWREHG